MLAFLTWWLIIQLFGLAALPLTQRILAWLPDRGYAFSKTVGLLLVTYLLWLGASTGILTNNPGGLTFALLITAGLSAWFGLFRPGARENLRIFWREHKSQILVVEVLFLLTFAGWELVRAFAPDKILPLSGEKYMEIAFLNGVLNSPRFPPLDPWLSGYAISYYYFGYVMMGVMTRFADTAPTVGFDLYDALMYALTAITAYGVVSNLVAAGGGSRRAARGFGLLGALFVGGMGNLEGLLEGLYSSRALPTAFWQWLDLQSLTSGGAQTGSFYPGNSWWWWNASRVLHDIDLFGKPVVFQPIDEFPAFSFLLGDNHPHKLALPFVLLAAGLALNLLLWITGRAVPDESGPGGLTGWQAWPAAGWLRRRDAGRPREAGWYLFYALALGGLAFLNTWDFPIYLGLGLLAFAAGWYLRGEPANLKLLLRTLALGFGLGIAALLLYIFFYIGFASQAGGILPYVFRPTRLAQYLVMFGPFIFILVFFIVKAAQRTSSGHFPLRETVRAWLWIVELSYAAYLGALILGALLLSTGRLPDNPVLQTWLGNASLPQALARTLLARLQDPWLFLLLSVLLALAVTAILRSRPVKEAAAVEISQVETKEEAGPGAIIYPADPPADACRLNPATVFALLLAFVGLALTLVVEFFYLRDNFGMRMNTIFKFYFQGWVMMACASAYAAWWVAKSVRPWARLAFSTTVVLLVAAGLVYPVMGIYSRDDAYQSPPNMDAAATFAGDYPNAWTYSWAAHLDDWAAVQWLRQNGRLPDGSVPNILEAGAGGYENAGRISAFTGFPTLLGWTNHEYQWRGTLAEISQRQPVVENIFTSYSPSQALDQLRNWNISYVILGETEREYVQKLCQRPNQTCDANRALGKFNSILTPVFTQGSTTVYRVPQLPKP